MLEHEVTEQALVPVTGGALALPLVDGQFKPTMDQLVSAWLHAKYNKSQSERTLRKYREHIGKFRAVLLGAGIDLDGDCNLIAMLAQGWAAKPESTRLAAVSAGTFNVRLTALSSFYEYGIRYGVLPRNPIKLVGFRTTSYSYAPPIEQGDIARRLQQIDRSAPVGLRDYAIISLAVTTGRRKAELLALQWGDFAFVGDKTIVTWQRTKGGKHMTDELVPGVRDAIIAYMLATHGDLDTIPPEAPMWLTFSNSYKGRKMGDKAIRVIWERRLGTPKVHASRHSFAVAMEAQGARLSDIGARLGHSNLQTTSVYLQRLHAAENKFASGLETAFGIGAPQSGELPQTKESEVTAKIRQARADHPELSQRAIARLLGIPAATARYHFHKLGSR